PIVDYERKPRCFENCLDVSEVLAVCFVEKAADARQCLDDRLILGNVAIEDAQRIGHGTALTVGTHSSDHSAQRLAECFVVCGTGARRSNRVKFQRPLFYIEAVEQHHQHLEDFGIAGRRLAASRRWTDHLRANLVELAISSFLWTLAS